MSKKGLIITICLVVLAGALVAGAAVYFGSVNVAVLNPQGEIAAKERNLIYFTLALSAVVVLPVFAMLGVFAWKFREGNEKAVYRPDWKSSGRLEVVWWGIPCLIILVLGIVAWRTSHDLDPYRSLDSQVKPITVQVVALQWKWLFIYPEQNIASVNLLEIPEKTPIAFTITADAPMNAFWIPNLGTQVYAMSGMSTALHLIANSPGDYRGSSSNISGKGFADMAFTARAVSAADFGKWVATSQRSKHRLDTATYEKLAMPGTEATPLIYQLATRELYDTIIKKYMTPGHETTRQQPPVDPPLNDKNPDMRHINHSDMPGMEGM